MAGKIIILNGTSSSGKTSLVKALQDGFDDPFLAVGLDRFINMLPSRFFKKPLWNGVLGLTVANGSVGHQLITGMHRTIAGLARAEINVVADHVLVEQHLVEDLAAQLTGLPAWFVGVHCDLEVLKKRETDRKDRTLGQAAAQFPHVHGHGQYDLEVDTTNTPTDELSTKIRSYVEADVPIAFARLRDQAR